MTVPFADKCSLRIPYPNAVNDEEHFENYKEISRWADRFQRECMPSGDGTWPFLVASSEAHEKVKAVADYQCTGTDDHLVINQAIADAGEASGSARAAQIWLSEGRFFVEDELSAAKAIFGVAGAGSFRGSVIVVGTALTGPVITTNSLIGVDLTMTEAVGTLIYVEQGPGVISRVGIFKGIGGSVTTGLLVDEGPNLAIDGLNISSCTTGISSNDAGNVITISNTYIQNCNTGLANTFGTTTFSSGAITSTPNSGTAITNGDGAILSLGALYLATTSDPSTGTTGIDNEGTLNTGAIGNVVFHGFVTDIVGGTGNLIVSEADADGDRIPLRDDNGDIIGYVGTTDGDVAIWNGDASAASDGDGPHILLRDQGFKAIEMSNGAGANAAWLQLTSTGDVFLGGTSLALLNGSGVDGTDTPSTAAELADVLVDLGIIASHTIT